VWPLYLLEVELANETVSWLADREKHAVDDRSRGEVAVRLSRPVLNEVRRKQRNHPDPFWPEPVRQDLSEPGMGMLGGVERWMRARTAVPRLAASGDHIDDVGPRRCSQQRQQMFGQQHGAGPARSHHAFDLVVQDVSQVVTFDVSGTIVDQHIEVRRPVGQGCGERAHRIRYGEVAAKCISPTWPSLADRMRNMLGRRQVAGREEDLRTAIGEGFSQ
jgi:hypothetical protein